VLYKDLAKAVKRESEIAVRYWWGVGVGAVWKWRKALGVPRVNEGTRSRLVAFGKSKAHRPAIEAMHAKARDPVRRDKIGAGPAWKAPAGSRTSGTA